LLSEIIFEEILFEAEGLSALQAGTENPSERGQSTFY
jgi:hypothetical protein